MSTEARAKHNSEYEHVAARSGRGAGGFAKFQNVPTKVAAFPLKAQERFDGGHLPERRFFSLRQHQRCQVEEVLKRPARSEPPWTSRKGPALAACSFQEGCSVLGSVLTGWPISWRFVTAASDKAGPASRKPEIYPPAFHHSFSIRETRETSLRACGGARTGTRINKNHMGSLMRPLTTVSLRPSRLNHLKSACFFPEHLDGERMSETRLAAGLDRRGRLQAAPSCSCSPALTGTSRLRTKPSEQLRCCRVAATRGCSGHTDVRECVCACECGE